MEILVACEGRASGVSCRVRRPIWQPIGYPAAPTHPPHAIGTRGPLGDQITSIEASFDFSVQRSLKYPHVRPQNGQLRDRVSPRKWTLPPSPVMGRTKGLFGIPQPKSRPEKWLGTRTSDYETAPLPGGAGPALYDRSGLARSEILGSSWAPVIQIHQEEEAPTKPEPLYKKD